MMLTEPCDLFPQPIPPSPNVAPWTTRWQDRLTVAVAVLLVLLGAAIATAGVR